MISAQISFFKEYVNVVKIPLPETFDQNGDDVSISFSNLPTYITLDKFLQMYPNDDGKQEIRRRSINRSIAHYQKKRDGQQE